MRKSRILSLLLAVAVMATMIVAVPLTASAAEASAMYAEWTLNGSYSSDSPAGTDTDSKSDVGADHILITGPSKDAGITTKPALYYNRNNASGNVKSTSSYSGEDTYMPYSGGTGTKPKTGLKTSADYGYTYIIDPKLNDDNNKVGGISPESYNLKIAFWGNSTDTTLKVIETTELKFGQVQNGEALTPSSGKTTTGSGVLSTVEYKGLKNYASFGFDQQPGLAYVGIEYVMPSNEPSIEIAPPTITAMEGVDQTIKATVKNITEPEITWKSSDDTKVKVTADVEDQTQATIQVQPGITEGTVDITAECTGTNQLEALPSNKCVVTIVPQAAVVTFTGSGIVGLKEITLTKTMDKNGAPVSDGSPKTYSETFKRTTSSGVAGITKEIKDVEFGTYSVTAKAADPYYTINGQIDNIVVNAASVSAPIPIEQVYVKHEISENNIANLTGTKTWSFDKQTSDSKEYLNLEGSDTVSVYSDDNKVFMNVDTKTGTWYQEDKGSYKPRNGKFNATNQKDTIQCNAMTYLDIPVIKGSTITIDGLDAENNSAFLEGKADSAKAELTAQVYKIDGTTSVGQPQKLSVDTQNSKKIATYKYDGEDIKAMVRIVSAGSWLNSIKVEYPELKIFGTTTDTDSGYYTESGEQAASNDQKLGVIRFFQSFDGNTKVEEYGFYFIDSADGTINESFKTFEKGNIEYGTVEGMYGDFMGIKNTDFSKSFYAKPYVKISGISEPIFGAAFEGKVGDSPKWVNKPDSAQ